MTPFEEKLAAIEARATAAQKGPWSWFESTGPVAEIRSSSGEIIGYTENPDRDDNAFFIAHARSDIPELINHLRECLSILEKKDAALNEFLMDPRLSEASRRWELGATAINLKPTFLGEEK